MILNKFCKKCKDVIETCKSYIFMIRFMFLYYLIMRRLVDVIQEDDFWTMCYKNVNEKK